jgi:hypothetical protein
MLAVIAGLVGLARQVDVPAPLWAAAIGLAVYSVVTVSGAWWPEALVAAAVVQVAATAGLLFALARLTAQTRWVGGLLALVAVLTLLDALSRWALLGPLEAFLPGLHRWVPLFNSMVLFAAALVARRTVVGTTQGLAEAGADFLAGAFALAVALLGLVLSVAVSKGAGFVVLAGAVGVGLWRVVRGFTRLVRSPV